MNELKKKMFELITLYFGLIFKIFNLNDILQKAFIVAFVFQIHTIDRYVSSVRIC